MPKLTINPENVQPAETDEHGNTAIGLPKLRVLYEYTMVVWEGDLVAGNPSTPLQAAVTKDENAASK